VDLVATWLTDAVAFLLDRVSGTASNWIADKLKDFVRNKRNSEVRQLLNDLGCRTEAEIRELVEGEGSKIPTRRREEVIALLVNLSRGARFLTIQGAPQIGSLGWEELVEQLLSGLAPVRKHGEMVAPGRNWRLERFLGSGTFGEVWMARNPWDDGLGRRAFKFFTREDAKQWILRERSNLSSIQRELESEPHVIKYYDVAIDGLIHPFLELEYVGGGSLEEWIVEADPSRRLELRKDEVLKGVVLGLARAHARHIYHRDLKPANILLTESPDVQAKIGDFGLAPVEDETNPASLQALQGGTPMYQPPELQRPWSERCPPQEDVFAVGVIWYQLLVESLDHPPYNFEDRLRKQGVDSYTIRLISRCLAHPEDRFRDACELKEAIDSLLPEPTLPPPGQPDVQHLVLEFLATLAQ